jgi:hypothetical protein
MAALLHTAVLLSPICGSEFRGTASVAAGATDRHWTPVSVDLTVPFTFDPGTAVVAASGEDIPAQLEVLSPAVVRVWWLVTDLPAAHAREYTIAITEATGGDAGFRWEDSSGGHGVSTDLLFEDRPVIRYMHTPFDEGTIEETKKPFHHVFTFGGSGFITKGVGGLYSHHRGIFFGYRQCRVDGAVYDTWHARDGEHQTHMAFEEVHAGDVFGGHVARISWNGRQGRPFAEERRQVRVFAQPENQRLIELVSTMKAVDAPVDLEGDRQHAGVQFRAAQEVADNKHLTRFLRPAPWAQLPPEQEVNSAEHRDLPWNAIQFPLGGQSYTVAYLSHPDNPGGADFSERLYGRFGEYFRWPLRVENPLVVRYRFWIEQGGNVTRDQIEQKYQDLALPPEVRLLDNHFLRGDGNADGIVDIADPVAILTYLFLGASPPLCEDAADANDDGRIDVSDAIATLLHLFLAGFDVPDPGTESRGPDRTADGLSCEAYAGER